jgi:hypothetical protein
LPEHEWLVTRYVDGRAYWIDIPWLKTMTEASTSISIQKIENLLCDGPLSTSIARHLFNETYDLTSYLADREPQACK